MKAVLSAVQCSQASELVRSRCRPFTRRPSPPVYYVAEIDVTNPDAYAKEYAPKAQAMIKEAGGRFLAMEEPQQQGEGDRV